MYCTGKMLRTGSIGRKIPPKQLPNCVIFVGGGGGVGWLKRGGGGTYADTWRRWGGVRKIIAGYSVQESGCFVCFVWCVRGVGITCCLACFSSSRVKYSGISVYVSWRASHAYIHAHAHYSQRNIDMRACLRKCSGMVAYIILSATVTHRCFLTFRGVSRRDICTVLEYKAVHTRKHKFAKQNKALPFWYHLCMKRSSLKYRQ